MDDPLSFVSNGDRRPSKACLCRRQHLGKLGQAHSTIWSLAVKDSRNWSGIPQSEPGMTKTSAAERRLQNAASPPTVSTST
jgi:hypothetical protein